VKIHLQKSQYSFVHDICNCHKNSIGIGGMHYSPVQTCRIKNMQYSSNNLLASSKEIARCIVT